MKNSKKITLVVLAFAFILAISPFMASLQTATAHTPPQEIPTYAYLVISPNPIGVGQPMFVVMWLHGAPPTAVGIAGDRWHDFTLEITKPDGTMQTLGPYVSDPTGSTFALYTPDQVGTYNFVFKYSGQVLTLVNPTNGEVANVADLTRWGSDAFIGDTFLPSSASATLTVQADPIAKIPDYGLPTNYWTFPIEGQNSAWATVTSQWLSGAYLGWVNPNQQNLWQKDGVAPNSAHIMWTRPIELGGIVGGSSAITGVGFYSGGSYEGRFGNAIIMAGRLYYAEPLGHAATGGGYTCVDLRTGEVIWHSDEIGVAGGAAVPTMGQLYDYESMNQHGVVGGTLWSIAGTTWKAYDAYTGKLMYTLTDVPSGREVYTSQGEIVRYVLNYNVATKKGSIALWNNVAEQQGLHGALGTGSSAYQWRPNGKTVNMSKAYSWNVSINYDLTGLAAPAIVSVIPGDVIIGSSTSFAWLGGIIQESPARITMWAISDRNDGTRGQLLWKQEYHPPNAYVTPYMGPVDPTSRVFGITYIETMDWYGYSVDTGEQLWGPSTGVENDFSYYGGGRGGGQLGFVAYGNLYTQGFGGELICYSMTTGNVMWRYANTNSGDETVWGNYPIFVAAIADGKVYAFNNEHSPNYPLYKGERVRCIDAFTGEEKWSMLGWAGQAGGPGTSTGILADGTLVYYNYYDNQLYAVGKGPSAVTVDAPLTAVTAGQSIVIRGTVTDISGGAKQLVADGKFNIVPAVADANMVEWMEFLYMQKPMPNANGVQVKLTAIDASGNSISIGTVTSDASGNYATMWTPPTASQYKIVAAFEGSDSYWPSSAETAVGVSAAATNGTEEAPASTTDIVIIVAVIIAILIGLVNLLALRKR